MSTYDGDYMKDTLERTIRRELTDKAREEGYAQALRDLLRLQRLCNCDHCQNHQAFICSVAEERGIELIDLEGNKP